MRQSVPRTGKVSALLGGGCSKFCVVGWGLLEVHRDNFKVFCCEGNTAQQHFSSHVGKAFFQRVFAVQMSEALRCLDLWRSPAFLCAICAIQEMGGRLENTCDHMCFVILNPAVPTDDFLETCFFQGEMATGAANLQSCFVHIATRGGALRLWWMIVPKERWWMVLRRVVGVRWKPGSV